MAALEFRVGSPMPVEQLRENLRFYFALPELFMVRRLIQPARFAACRRHDPEMRNLLVRIEVYINRVEHDPFSIRRRHRRADAFQFHHVLESKWPLAARDRRSWCRLRESWTN